MATMRRDGRACARALSDRRSLLKNEYSPAATISPLAAAQNPAFRIGVLLYPFNPATASQVLLHGFGFYRLLGALSRH
jgi:hypothetical protein